MREAIRLKHYSIRTEQAHIDWIRRYILLLITAQATQNSEHQQISCSELGVGSSLTTLGVSVADCETHSAGCAF
jgi:hypothetical protein